MKTMTEEELIVHNHAADTLKTITRESALLNTANNREEFNTALEKLRIKIILLKFE